MQQNMRKQLILIIVMMFTTSIAMASTITVNSSGTFSNARGGNSEFYKYREINYQHPNSGPYQFGTGNAFYSGTSTYGRHSQIAIFNNQFDLNLDAESEFLLGTLVYGYDEEHYRDHSNADQVDFNLQLACSGADTVNWVTDLTQTLHFHTYQKEIEKEGQTSYVNVGYFSLPTKQGLGSFTYNKTRYSIELSRIGDLHASHYALGFDGQRGAAIISENEIHAVEQGLAIVNLYAKVTAQPMSSTPEPGTFVLAAMGLLGITGFMRKRD